MSQPKVGQELTGGLDGRGSALNANLRLLPNGTFVDSTGCVWGFKAFDAADQLNEPKGVCFDPADGTLYVADSGNGRVQRFLVGERCGQTIAGGQGGKIDSPVDVVITEDGALFVSDSGADRVLRFPPIFY